MIILEVLRRSLPDTSPCTTDFNEHMVMFEDVPLVVPFAHHHVIIADPLCRLALLQTDASERLWKFPSCCPCGAAEVLWCPSVYRECEAVAGVGIAQTPHRYAPFHRLRWHVLLTCLPPVKPNHCLVDGEVTRWGEAVMKCFFTQCDE